MNGMNKNKANTYWFMYFKGLKVNKDQSNNNGRVKQRNIFLIIF